MRVLVLGSGPAPGVGEHDRIGSVSEAGNVLRACPVLLFEKPGAVSWGICLLLGRYWVVWPSLAVIEAIRFRAAVTLARSRQPALAPCLLVSFVKLFSSK